MRRFIVAVALSMAGALPLRAQTQMLDDFETLAGWSAQPSDGVTLAIRSDAGHHGRSMRLDFDFHGGGGYAVVRKAIAIDLPENYEFTAWLRADAPVNNLEKILGCFLRVGAREPGGEHIPAHSQRFYAAEESVFIGAAVLSETARVASESVAG